MKPLGRNILIQEIKEPKNESSLELPPNSNATPLTGKVIAIGMEVREASIGDTVLVGRTYGREMIVDNTHYKLIEEDNIFVIL